jgi:hypothetical protein
MTVHPAPLYCSLILLALAPACRGKAPAAAPANAPTGRAEATPLLRSFWDTHRPGHGSRRCTTGDYQAVTARADDPAGARAEAWAAAIDDCWLDWQGEDGGIDAANLAAYVGFGTALLEAGFPHDCEALMTAVTTPYAGGLSDLEVPEELQPLVDDALALGERCGAAAEAELAAFVPPTCPSDDACFALVEGVAAPADTADTADEDPDAEMMEEDVVCPQVELRTAAGARRLVAEGGALLDTGFCCGISAISTAVVGGRRYLLVRPSGEDSMFIRVCSGGTASATPASVYRVEGDHLVLEADRSLLWH